MTDKHNNQGDEAVNEPDITALYRSTRSEEPSASLDGHILAEARLSARRRRNRWLLPLSSAAVVMLGLTLTLKLLDQEPTLPSVDDFAVDEAAEVKSIPQRSMAEKKQKALTPGKVEMGVSSTMEEQDAELRLRKMAPAEELPRPAAVGRAAVPLPQGVRALAEDEQPLRQESESVNNMSAMEPELWLEHIIEMVDTENIDEAVAELKRFRASYPDYSIPEELRQLNRLDVE